MPNVTFLLAGEGDLAPSMSDCAAALAIDSSVVFLGRIERIAELLAISDICVLSSKSEGFPNVILEYMAAGRPVVATDVGGTREAVLDGETGYLVAAGDDGAMATRILGLLRDPVLSNAMGANGRRRVDARFTSGAQLDVTIRLYDALLTDRYCAATTVCKPRPGRM